MEHAGSGSTRHATLTVARVVHAAERCSSSVAGLACVAALAQIVIRQHLAAEPAAHDWRDAATVALHAWVHLLARAAAALHPKVYDFSSKRKAAQERSGLGRADPLLRGLHGPTQLLRARCVKPSCPCCLDPGRQGGEVEGVHG